MNIKVRNPNMNLNQHQISEPYTFVTNKEVTQSWETWHCCFGHIGYSGLKRLFQKGLVHGFAVDERTPKPDCPTCTEAKQAKEPFPHFALHRRKEPGALTHMDLWGPMSIEAIEGERYFLSLTDDAKRYITVKGLKSKDQAQQKIKDYLTLLKTQGMCPQAVRFDRGREFLNKDLEDWLKEQGIEIEPTAPESPSQNGVAEQMNRTLLDLTRAMLIEKKLPHFLWLYAVKHAAYLRNRAYTKALEHQTPYEGWTGKKPDVTHLQEFGVPVWIL